MGSPEFATGGYGPGHTQRLAEGALRPETPPALASQLASIQPSIVGTRKYFPCSVELKDATKLDCVYIVAQHSYIADWGIYPQGDLGKSEIDINEVVSIGESRSRLPVRFANLLHAAGESGMGYSIFTVIFSDGAKQSYEAGNAVDFISYPEGKNAADVADVQPHVGRDATRWRVPKYYWCLYTDEETKCELKLGLTRPLPVQQPLLWARLKTYIRRLFLFRASR
jgi:hypothetical protein